MKFEEALRRVIEEHGRATKGIPAFNSVHEGFAVILEEVDELKAEVWKKPRLRDKAQMRKEAVQVAAMAMRFLIELL